MCHPPLHDREAVTHPLPATHPLRIDGCGLPAADGLPASGPPALALAVAPFGGLRGAVKAVFNEKGEAMMHRITVYAASVATAAAVGGLGMASIASAAVARGPGQIYSGRSYSPMSHSNNGNNSNNETLYSTIQAQEGTELAQTSQTSSPGSRADVNQDFTYLSYTIFRF
jgi:hypothetical protein